MLEKLFLALIIIGTSLVILPVVTMMVFTIITAVINPEVPLVMKMLLGGIGIALIGFIGSLFIN